MKRREIKAIIFDLGGVILEVDYQRTIDAFVALGINDFDAHYNKSVQSGLFDKMETGQLSNDAFLSELQLLIPSVSKEQIAQAWNAIIMVFPANRISFLIELKKQYPTFLLSNTNAIHLEYFNQILKRKHQLNSIHDGFHKAYLSHEIRKRKPNTDAFQLILDEQNLNPETTLFIDDLPQHIAAADALGLQTLHLKSIHALEQELTPLLTKFN